MDSGTNSTDLLQQVVERAAKDGAFRQALLADAKGALEREYGVLMPSSIKLQVVEESPTSRYLVLPAAHTQPGSDLSDAELESVAGGWTAYSDCGSCQLSCGPTIWSTCPMNAEGN